MDANPEAAPRGHKIECSESLEMLRTIPLPNKPLCITSQDDMLYIGDARGTIYSVSYPYLVPRRLLDGHGPVSSIVFLGEQMYFGTWDGTVCTGEIEKRLGSNPVKCMCACQDRIFVSVDTKLVVLDMQLTIVEEYCTENKIYCMDFYEGRLRFGLGTGLLSSYRATYEPAEGSGHETTVLCMKGNLTGSSDCTLREGGRVVFAGDAWIRSIYDRGLFSCGASVHYNNSLIYSHKDEVVGILKVGDKIVSIGLDYCYCVFEDGDVLDDIAEQELMEMLASE